MISLFLRAVAIAADDADVSAESEQTSDVCV